MIKKDKSINYFQSLAYFLQFLYGGWFLFHGMNYWFEFYFDKSIQPGPGLVPALAESGVMFGVKVLEVVIGLALLLNLYVPLAVVAAWPVTLMIAFVTSSHGKPFGICVALIIISINAIMALGHLDRYRPMLVPHAGAPNLEGLSGGFSDDRSRLARRVHVWAAPLGLIAAIIITYISLYLRS